MKNGMASSSIMLPQNRPPSFCSSKSDYHFSSLANEDTTGNNNNNDRKQQRQQQLSGGGCYNIEERELYARDENFKALLHSSSTEQRDEDSAGGGGDLDGGDTTDIIAAFKNFSWTSSFGDSKRDFVTEKGNNDVEKNGMLQQNADMLSRKMMFHPVIEEREGIESYSSPVEFEDESFPRHDFCGVNTDVQRYYSTNSSSSFDYVNSIEASRVVQTEHGPALLLPENLKDLAGLKNMQRTLSPLKDIKNNRKFKRWSEGEDKILKHAISIEGEPPYNWKKIASTYFENTRSGLQCKSRWTKSLQPGLLRGSWQPHEDDVISSMRPKGAKWSEIAEMLPGRIGEHVRDRYVNFLDPNLKKSAWTKEEDSILFQEQRRLGNKWTEISKSLPGRSENAVKNRWHNAKMTQRRRMRKQASERTRVEQNKRARQHHHHHHHDDDDENIPQLTSEEKSDEELLIVGL